MRATYSKVLVWFQAHPHTLVSLCLGIGIGIGITIPLGWTLPDSIAALMGALIGAGAVVGASLWAANAKQAKEDAKADERSRHIASYVATAIHGEIAVAARIIDTLGRELVAGIEEADSTGNKGRILVCLETYVPQSAMCEKFMDKVDAFGDDAVTVFSAIDAILTTKGYCPSLHLLISKYPWDARYKEVVDTRARAAKLQSDTLLRALGTLAKYSPIVEPTRNFTELALAQDRAQKSDAPVTS